MEAQRIFNNHQDTTYPVCGSTTIDLGFSTSLSMMIEHTEPFSVQTMIFIPPESTMYSSLATQSTSMLSGVTSPGRDDFCHCKWNAYASKYEGN